MWGVLFRPVQMAKQEARVRGAADNLHTHSHSFMSLLMTTPEQKKQKRPAAKKAEKANDVMLSAHLRIAEKLIVSSPCQR